MLSQYQYETTYSLFTQILQHPNFRSQFGDQVAQKLMQLTHPHQGDPQWKGAYSQYIEETIPPHVWNSPQGVDANFIHQQLAHAAEAWGRSIQQASQPNMGMGGMGYGGSQNFGMSPYGSSGGQGSFGMPMSGPTTMHDDGLTPAHAPMNPAPATPNPPMADNMFLSPDAATAFSNTEAAAPAQPSQKDNSIMQTYVELDSDVQMTERDEHDMLVPCRLYGLDTECYLTGQTAGGIKVTSVTLKQRRPMNSPFDVLRNAWAAIGNHLPIGEFSVIINYDRLKLIPIPTKRLIEISRMIAEDQRDGAIFNISDAVETLGKLSKNEWQRLDTLICAEVNAGLSRWCRENHIVSTTLRVGSLDGLTGELLRVPEQFSKHPAFYQRLTDNVATHAFRKIFGELKTNTGREGIIRSAKDDFAADVFGTDGVELDLTGSPELDKFNALRTMSNEDFNIAVQAILDDVTVVRTPETIVIQNVVRGEGVVDPKKVDVRLFGCEGTVLDGIFKAISTAEVIYGVRRDLDPSKYLARFAPIVTLESDYYLHPISGVPGMD